VRLIVRKTERLSGTVAAPASKSHTHRAIVSASLAEGKSAILNPLACDDTAATIEACRLFGAGIAAGGEALEITGFAGRPKVPKSDIHVGDSGTTLRLMAGIAALCDGAATLTGTPGLCARPMDPLLRSLADLGAKRSKSLRNDGCAPVCVGGRMSGGATKLDAQSSQFVSALLIACPLAENDSVIDADGVRSRPYVDLTLKHLERSGIKVWSRDGARFFVPGGQSYAPADFAVPGDWSSAAFLRAAAIVTCSDIEVLGLDSEDGQGDRAFSSMAEKIMSGNGTTLDLGDTPDLLPALAVVACCAEGETALGNVGHARMKESDRISAMCTELRKMGAEIEELPDGLLVRGSELKGAELDGHGDHRIAMALAVAGLAAEGETIINNAHVISKSYPDFARDLAGLGADIRAV